MSKFTFVRHTDDKGRVTRVDVVHGTQSTGKRTGYYHVATCRNERATNILLDALNLSDIVADERAEQQQRISREQDALRTVENAQATIRGLERSLAREQEYSKELFQAKLDLREQVERLAKENHDLKNKKEEFERMLNDCAKQLSGIRNDYEVLRTSVAAEAESRASRIRRPSKRSQVSS